MEKAKIHSFTDLEAWKQGHKLVLNQLLIARDLKYLQNENFHEIADQTICVAKLIRSLIKYVES